MSLVNGLRGGGQRGVAAAPSLRALKLLLLGAAGCQSEPVDPLCHDAQPNLLASGEPSGFERCADGAVNRVVAVLSVGVTNNGEACHGDEQERACEADADCTAGANGRCLRQDGGFYQSCRCLYACAGDADCASDKVCVPIEVTDGAERSSCVPATCRTGADCASGACGLADYHDGCFRVSELRCRDGAAIAAASAHSVGLRRAVDSTASDAPGDSPLRGCALTRLPPACLPGCLDNATRCPH